MNILSKNTHIGIDENEVLIISFSNDDNYLMIQDPIHYDEQDIKLGMDTYYLEVNNQSTGGYGGIKEFQLDSINHELTLKFNDDGVRRIGCLEAFISFSCSPIQLELLRAELNKI